PDCGHPMQADQDSCVCVVCGTVCTGHFGGCPDVWTRGPIPVNLIPSRPVSVPTVEDDEPLLIVSTPAVRDADIGPDDEPFAPPVTMAARPQPAAATQGVNRDRLLSVLASTFRDLQQQ